ncbi:MAG: hypothetical protein COA86_02740 [Kangiella sp.]|nr:MAG: hypothetical protein COA86_02740 [Kangiella sp.]
MRVFNSEYDQFVQSSNKSSRWAIQVAFDDAATDFVYFTSHDDVPIPAGETVVHGVLRNVGAVLQQLKPAKFNSTIGNLSFSLVNVNGNVESELRAKRALGIHLFGKRARLFSGGVGLQWGSYIIETTQWISSEFDYRKNQYLVSCKDSQSLMDKTVNRPPETRLSAGVGSSDLTLPIYNSSEFNLVQQDSLFVEAPNELCTFIEISDNNQKEFCKVTAITATELTVVRGVMGTTAFGWAVPNNADEDRGPKIKEMFTIDMNMAKFAWAFLTGEDLDNIGVNLFPEGRHCNVPTNQLVRQEFIDLQAENATKAQHMALKKVNGKQFFEEQIALSLGYYLGVNGEGLMNLRSLNSVHSNNNVVGTIGQNEMVDFSSLKHDASEVANFISMFWSWDERPNKPEYRRKATFVIKNSKTQFGEKPLSVFLQLLNASTSTSSTLLAIANRYMSRYAGDSVYFSCKTLRKQARFETGDIINVEHPSIADYTGNGSLGRAMQIVGKSISQSKGITFKFFGSSLVADPITDGDVRAMADSYYDSEGQVIPNVSANSLTTETTLVGGVDIHAAANVYYHLGDLNLSSKLNIEQNVQLRVRGFITGTEFINCVGNGRAAGGGYIGTSIGKSGSDEYIDFTGWDASYEVNGDVNTGQHDAFPVLTLDNLDGTIINGIPSDLRGSAGASGGDSLYENNQTNESESSSGATGNDSGSGLMVVCRGMSLSGNANIDMSGVAGNVAVDSVPSGFAIGGNGGHSTPGGILILLDGGTSSVPNINGRMTALSNDPSYDAGMDIGQSVARIQFIPKARVPVEDDPIDDSSTALYTWIKFADDAVGAGLTDDPTGKAYLGIAVNQAVQAEGTNAAVYTWSKILGDNGNDGVGQDGADGTTTYTWVKYADDIAGAGLTNDPTNKDYIGLAFNKTTAIESTIAGDYTWSLYVGSDGVAGADGANGTDGLQGLQGNDGADGIAGTNGVDGVSTYFHIAYADTIAGTGFSQNPAGKLYIGTYVDSVVADANSTSNLWNWQLVVGSDGADGTNGSDGIAGTNGTNGQTSYLHIAYANDSAGSTGFSTTNSVDKFYIGQYTDFVLADSNIAGDYSWTLIRGADGSANLIDPREWVVGTTGSQGSFLRNGLADENSIVLDVGPHGITEPIWRCQSNIGDGLGADGGWINDSLTSENYDPTKTYRFSVWAKQSESVGTVYLGCLACLTLADVVTTNPYFWNGDLPTNDKWYLIIGVLHGSSYTGSDLGISGVYDPSDGSRVIDATEFKSDGSSTQRHRAYLYYSNSLTNVVQFSRPRVDEVNGNEPSLSDLMGRLATDGDTIYEIYEYSIDGATLWHSDFLTSDMFRRTATVTNGVVGAFSSAAQISGNTPVEGSDYYITDGSFKSYVFTTSVLAPATPSGGSFTGTVETAPASWQDDPYYTEGEITWVSTSLYTHNAVADTWSNNAWSTPSEYSVKGDSGTSGSSALNSGRRSNDLSLWYRNITRVDTLTSPFITKTVSDGPIWGDALSLTDNNDNSHTVVSEAIGITPGQKYRVSAQVRQPVGDRRNYLIVIFYDSSDVRISNLSTPVSDSSGWPAGQGSYNYYLADSVFPTTWTKYYTEFGGDAIATIPSNAVTMAIGGLFVRQGDVGTNTTIDIQDMHIVEVAKDGTNGIDGLQGLQGADGTNGINGADGTSTYFHIAYADTITGTGFSQDPAGKLYIGTYVDSIVADAGSGSGLWNWQLVVGSDGADGSDGLAGSNGTNGQTSYLHIAYANDAAGATGFSTTDSTNKFYIGQYTDFILADSNTASLYSWTLIRGADGQDGSDGLGANPILNSTNDPKTGLTHISVGNGITITWSLAENSESSFNTNDPPAGFITLNLKRNGITIDTIQVVDRFESDAGEGYWEYGSNVRTINDTPGVGTHTYTVTTDQDSTDVVESSTGIITTREEQ